jgi:hypothetical protein
VILLQTCWNGVTKSLVIARSCSIFVWPASGAGRNRARRTHVPSLKNWADRLRAGACGAGRSRRFCRLRARRRSRVLRRHRWRRRRHAKQGAARLRPRHCRAPSVGRRRPQDASGFPRRQSPSRFRPRPLVRRLIASFLPNNSCRIEVGQAQYRTASTVKCNKVNGAIVVTYTDPSLAAQTPIGTQGVCTPSFALRMQ